MEYSVYSRFVAVALLLLAPVAARGQSESKSQAAAKQAAVIDIRVVEADTDAAAELQR